MVVDCSAAAYEIIICNETEWKINKFFIHIVGNQWAMECCHPQSHWAWRAYLDCDKMKNEKKVGNVVSKNDLIPQQKQKQIKKIYSNAFTTWKQKPRMNNNNKMK